MARVDVAGAPRPLTDAQLRHFAEHGWVLQEAAFTADECAEYRAAIDRLVARDYCISETRRAANERGRDPEQLGAGVTNVDNMINSGEPLFLSWITHPHILPVLKQLLGTPPSYEGCCCRITLPHPKRTDPAFVEKALQPSGYHRGIRPKWGIVPSDAGPPYINTTFLNNICYFTDIESELDGGTALLSGSHRTDSGDARADVQTHLARPGGGIARLTSVKAGSVLHFTESLIHSAVPVLSESTRYVMFYGFTPPWMRVWNNGGDGSADAEVVAAAEGELKEILLRSHAYGGQYDALQGKL